ncbi:MAG TPA: membrane protein insertase YidC [Methylibium sp.]|uniref:membrane protein insertase YidC n=1 Tax=Methylibium sp. TaxID=2067992 RepID=UPI002DBBF865|nr:membrane protein insertase YidC [Methylibium sp.]HEU4459515.1 membrane protein insertase YidC [Methylibium sp.]
MTDLRRTLLWGVFLMSLFLLWDGWNKQNGRGSFFEPQVRSAAPAAPANGGASSAPGAVPTPSSGAGTAAGAPPAGAAPAAATAATVTVATDILELTFDTRGADVVRAQLLTQVDQADRSKSVVLLERSASRLYVAQTGLVGAPGLPNHLTSFRPVPGETRLAPDKNTLEVAFEAGESGGVIVRKTYTLTRGNYLIDVRHEIRNEGSAAVTPQLYLQLVRDGNVEAPSIFLAPTSFTGPAIYTDAGKFQKMDFTDIEKGKAEHVKTADSGWVAMVQHYFFSAWLHAPQTPREFYARKVDTNLYAVGELLTVGSVEPGASKTVASRLYLGPQEETKIETLAPGLDLVKDYGWFTILAKPLFWLLDKLHGLLGNWGWAIVALVVLLKLAFYSLNASAYKSMAKMKAVNPRVQELRERLKDKPQQMQQEMMRIYKEEKVNPLGGCLPILVQMPVFIALYWVLLSSVEMRNAPWVLWIKDLSVQDPYYILPVVMTATTLLQTWLNPTPPDPMQARLMWIMPLVFGVMFFFFPAGLVLYWITNNVLSIAQQYVINKRLGVA